MWLAIGAGVITVITALALIFRWMMDAPMFEPGTVEKRLAALGETLEPPGTDPNETTWRVTNDILLHHESTGSGDDLLLVHGGPGYPPRGPWKAAALLASRFRVHTYHQRGCGLSTRPIERLVGGSFYDKLRRVEDTLGLAEQIADIERIRRRLGRERIALVGQSFGALLAALYASEFPDRVSALILVAPAPLFTMPREAPDLFESVRVRLPDDQREEYARYMREYFDLRAALERDEPTLSRHFGAFRGYYSAATGISPPPNDGDVGGFMTVAVYASLGRRHDWRPALARIRAPTLVLHGANDLQPEADTRMVAEAIPDARVEVIPHSGHFLPDEAPDAFAQSILRFMDERR